MLTLIEKTRDDLLQNFNVCMVAGMDAKENIYVVAGGELDFPHYMTMAAQLLADGMPDGMADDEMFWELLKDQVKRISAERK